MKILAKCDYYDTPFQCITSVTTILAFVGAFLLGGVLGLIAGVYATIKACEWDDKACARRLISK